MSASIPYVVGQWVRGDCFYGRVALLDELLSGEGATWVAGTRRIGKTSLLRQLELLAARSSRLVPLYWDLQGVDSAEELAGTFFDALLDAGESLARLGIDPSHLATLEFETAADRLTAAVSSSNRTLLLLLDEAEELISLARRDVQALARLNRCLARDGVRTAAVASVNLNQLAGAGREARFLLDLVSPPRFLPSLADSEAASLVRQDQLPASSRPQLAATTVERISRHCGNHPFLLQLLARRVLETGDLERSIELLHSDRVLHYLFKVDLDLLAPPERDLLLSLARGEARAEGAAERLLELGLVGRAEGGALAVGNDFLARWLLRS